MLLFFMNSTAQDGNPNPNNNPKNNPKSPTRADKFWKVLVEQLVNSAVIAGITGISTLAADPNMSLRTAGIAFGMTFFAEMRKYRKI